MTGKLHEECAVFGISIDTDEAVGITYNGLLALQHRGQEGTGIAVACDNTIYHHKNIGLVSEVFGNSMLGTLPKSCVAIGHNRYSTMGSNTLKNMQPFVTEYLTGRLATVHNGSITNAKSIKETLKKLGVKFDATSDSEVVSSLIAYYTVKYDDVLKGTIKAAEMLEGAFSLIVLCGHGKLIAVRDASGYRPMCIGKNAHGIVLASETCALDCCGFEFLRDVQPGEVILIENGQIINETKLNKQKEIEAGLCIFEYIYFARPDSVIDGLSVYEARYNMGSILADEHPVDADVVCGVPDSGLEAAAGYSARSGIPLVSGFVKNRYIGRSFIYPTQIQRESAVRIKLNPLRRTIENKRIVLIDDSIVRGTTSEKIVRALKNAGAKEVHMRVSAPPFKFTCHYGTDIDNEANLIANRMDLDGIAKKIGADSLGYISIDGLKRACSKCDLSFCTKCFTGNTNDHRKNELE
jgi:amidophosphoribosyltransferase